MTTTWLTEYTRLAAGSAATIGFFDGVHRGHRYLVEQLCRLASVRGCPSMVVTFDRHPREVVCPGWRPQLLTSLQEKEELLAQTGIDRLVVVPFDAALASLPAHDFMRHVLRDQLGVTLLLTGYDNRFGHRSPGSNEGFDDYTSYGRELGIDVACAKGLRVSDCGLLASGFRVGEDECFVCSSLVRQLLSDGRVGDAACCLGRRYRLRGVVEHGEQQGRQMGFPTANLRLLLPAAMVPGHGVYAVRVEHASSVLSGMTNIGTRPTFDGHRLTIETHIFDFSGDLYGEQLGIEFVSRLRDEQVFSTVDDLSRQMTLDAAEAKQILSCL